MQFLLIFTCHWLTASNITWIPNAHNLMIETPTVHWVTKASNITLFASSSNLQLPGTIQLIIIYNSALLIITDLMYYYTIQNAGKCSTRRTVRTSVRYALFWHSFARYVSTYCFCTFSQPLGGSPYRYRHNPQQ